MDSMIGCLGFEKGSNFLSGVGHVRPTTSSWWNHRK